MDKINLVICSLAVIILFGTEQTLFWFAVFNFLIFLGSEFAIPNIAARNAMKRNEESIEKMRNKGATQEEIVDYIEINDDDRKSIPQWIKTINFITKMLGAILLINGILIRF
ncbi:hypothetical protein [Natranaerofaba carboxydovora]|uniref:hypothetical protein n=1 Tax=Natranaerofaba carboxydovora TaxID=2742683 RepID=UPI001F1394FE|nr:hypothetical protein [Natranaerofaba carboxydovora]UMZ73569.1 hypothetical protein ACONDI_01125 [Natranaerofaba carboxydovora]